MNIDKNAEKRLIYTGVNNSVHVKINAVIIIITPIISKR